MSESSPSGTPPPSTNGDAAKQSEINSILWRACDTFRGTVDPSEYKNYILVMLFIKYISDVWRDHYDTYRQQYGDDEERIQRRMQRERFVLPPDCDFAALYRQRKADNIGEVINKALDEIEHANRTKLEGVFRNIDFNSEAHLGKTRDRNARLLALLEDFAHPALDLRPSRIGNLDVIGNAYIPACGSGSRCSSSAPARWGVTTSRCMGRKATARPGRWRR
jgi:type I restriction enzyme M protein